MIFLRNVRNGHFVRKPKKNTTTIVAIAITTEIVIEKQQKITGIADIVPSCNYCVATIVARPLGSTVKGGRQPSGRKIRALFPRIQESGGVSGLELFLTYINF